jgi:hypothetical protein
MAFDGIAFQCLFSTALWMGMTMHARRQRYDAYDTTFMGLAQWLTLARCAAYDTPLST